MEFITTIKLSGDQLGQLHQLWNNEYPIKLRYLEQKEFENYLNSLSDKQHILLVSEEVIYGWYFDFLRADERWFALLLNSSIQRKGYGHELLNQGKGRRVQLNGWVIDHNDDSKQNGDRYNSPLDFYVKNGFEVLSGSRLKTDRISAVKINWRP